MITLHVEIRHNDLSAGKQHFASGPVFIGRQAGSQIFLHSQKVSRHHASLFTDQSGKWFIQDLGSRNHTQLDGNRVDDKAPLPKRGVIQVGDFNLLFRQEETADVQKPELPVTSSEPPKPPPPAASLPPLPEGAIVRGEQQPLQVGAFYRKHLFSVMLKLIQQPDQDLLLKTILTLTRETLSSEHVWVGLRTDYTGPIAISSGQSRDGRLIDDRHVPAGIISHVLDAGEYLLLPKVSASSEIGSAIAAPINTPRGRLGVLYADRLETEADFTQSDLDFLTVLASQIAVAAEFQVSRRDEERLDRGNIEMSISRKMVSHLSTRRLPIIKGYELAAYGFPGRMEGIDYHDALFRSDGWIILLMGHVDEQELSAVCALSTIRAGFRMATHFAATAPQLASHLNRLLISTRASADTQILVNLNLALINNQSGKLSLCNAGFQPPLILRNNGNVQDLDASVQLPLGVEATSKYTAAESLLHAGDTLILFSRGLIEARNADRQAFGLDNLRMSITDNFGQPAGTLLKEVIRDLQDHVGQYIQTQPISLMVLRRE